MQVWTILHCLHHNKHNGVPWALFADIDEFLEPMASIGALVGATLPPNMTQMLGNSPVNSYSFGSTTTEGALNSECAKALQLRVQSPLSPLLACACVCTCSCEPCAPCVVFGPPGSIEKNLADKKFHLAAEPTCLGNPWATKGGKYYTFKAGGVGPRYRQAYDAGVIVHDGGSHGKHTATRCGDWWGHRKQLLNLTQACWSNVHDTLFDASCRSESLGPKKILQMPTYTVQMTHLRGFGYYHGSFPSDTT